MNKRFRYRWNGSAWAPLQRVASECREAFVVGQIEDLELAAERSRESHNHYFACLHTAWLNLPEHLQDRFPTDDHLRRWCLIKRGYRKERAIILPSPDIAQQVAALSADLDEYAVVQVHGNIVAVWTAESQKLKRSGNDGMLKERFERSKSDVLEECSKLVGVDVTTLSAQEAPSIAPDQERERARERA